MQSNKAFQARRSRFAAARPERRRWASMKTLLPVVAIAIAGCAPSLSEPDARSLAQDALPLFQERLGVIPTERWPASVAALEPKNVQLRSEGVYIALSSFLVAEQGFFIPSPAAAFAPSKGTDPSYELIAHGVFKYRIKG
jgi:hypothetical protein